MVFQKWIGASFGTFFKDLRHEIDEDDIFNGAATLAYYWMLAIFPAMIFLLSLLPYLPVANLHGAIMDFMAEALPQESASMFSGVISEVTMDRKAGLLSFGVLATIWAASNGMYAIMRQLNKTYDVHEARSFIKGRSLAVLMTLVFGLIIIGAFSLIVFGGYLQSFLVGIFGFESAWLLFFRLFRWAVIIGLLLLGFASIYYYGPNVEQKFRFITPGSALGVLLLIIASLGFQVYVNNFADYAATYGSIGAVIILMLWLYIAGVVILLGSEVNALIEHYSKEGKSKGQKEVPAQKAPSGFQPHPSR